jgi:hypothetical protein
MDIAWLFENGKVVNLCIAEPSDIKPTNWVLCESGGIGYDYDGAKPFYIYFNYWYCNRDYIDRFLKFIKMQFHLYSRNRLGLFVL